MRIKLKPHLGKRLRFVGRVADFGYARKENFNFIKSKNNRRLSVLMIDIKFYRTGKLATDHLWIKTGKWSKHLKPGDIISFEAKVIKYAKGYIGEEGVEFDRHVLIDYQLIEVTKVKNHNQEEQWSRQIRAMKALSSSRNAAAAASGKTSASAKRLRPGLSVSSAAAAFTSENANANDRSDVPRREEDAPASQGEDSDG